MKHEVAADPWDGHPYCRRCGVDLDDGISMATECEGGGLRWFNGG